MKPREHGFTDFDAQPDPSRWVEVLDTLGQDPLYAAYKRRVMELLDPHGGGRYLEIGTGSDAIACAQRFGVSVVGVDSSRTMVQEAVRRGLADAVLADAHSLPDQDLARRVLGFRADHAIRNGTLAHRMGRLFADAGIVDVRPEEAPVVVRDPTALDNVMGLRDWARFACERGLVDGHEVEAWERALDEAAAAGCFRYSFSIFITAGRRP
jgi:hypothetical protein